MFRIVQVGFFLLLRHRMLKYMQHASSAARWAYIDMFAFCSVVFRRVFISILYEISVKIQCIYIYYIYIDIYSMNRYIQPFHCISFDTMATKVNISCVMGPIVCFIGAGHPILARFIISARVLLNRQRVVATISTRRSCFISTATMQPMHTQRKRNQPLRDLAATQKGDDLSWLLKR